MKKYSVFHKAPRLEPCYQMGLMSNPEYSFGGCGEGSYPSAQIQSVYSTAPADWALIRSCWDSSCLDNVR